jgi:hypothetical protein
MNVGLQDLESRNDGVLSMISIPWEHHAIQHESHVFHPSYKHSKEKNTSFFFRSGRLRFMALAMAVGETKSLCEISSLAVNGGVLKLRMQVSL